MKAKKYRLETVLGIRHRTRDEAARQVAVRLQHLQAAEEELARRQRKLQACYEQQNKAQASMNEELRKGIQAQNVLAHQNYLNDLRKLEIELKADVEKQIQTVTKAEKELETAREKLSETARDLKSIEIHKENWQDSQNKEKNRREQKISDEIGAILHGRRESS
jgi:flagellar export protein FliJ